MKNVKLMLLTVFAASIFAPATAQDDETEYDDDFNVLLLCIAVGVGLLIVAICACLGLKGCVSGGSGGGQMNCGDCFCVYRELYAPNRPRPEMQDKSNQTVIIMDGELEGDAELKKDPSQEKK